MNMKRIIFLIIALLPFIACAQNNIKKTASIAYTNGAPTFTPNISYSTELAVDTVTSNLYWWSRNASAWTKYPRGVDVIAGSVVPSYTPRDNQALFAINADNELYYYTGATWIQIGGSGGGGVYGGSGTTGAAVTTVTIDSILAFSNTSGNPARFSVLMGDVGGTYFETKTDTGRWTYFDIGGTNGYYLGPDGLKLRTASPDRAIFEGLDARYAADYSGTYSDRSLIDKGYADATYTATGDVSGTSGQVALFTGTNTVGGSANLTYTSPSLLMGGSSPTATIADAAASSATSGGLLSLASYDNAANVFGDRLGSITFRGQTNGSGGTGPGARIDAYAFGTWSASSHPTALTFFTTSPSATSGTERFRIYANTARLRSATSLGFDNAGNTILIYSFLPTADTALELSTSQGGEFRFGGKIGFASISRTYTKNQNNVFLGPYTYFTVTASGANIDFTGMLRSSVINQNRIITFYNNGGAGTQLNNLVIKHESASSTAANRFFLPGEEDMIIAPYEGAAFIYDNTLSRWVVYGQSREMISRNLQIEYYATETGTGTVTASSTITDNLYNPGSLQATLTYNLPASPVDGQLCKITFNNTVTTLTVSGNGNTLSGTAATSAAVGTALEYKFYNTVSAWIRIQ